MLEKKFHYIRKFLDYICNINTLMQFSINLYRNYSVILHYFCINSKVTFRYLDLYLRKFSTY